MIKTNVKSQDLTLMGSDGFLMGSLASSDAYKKSIIYE